MARKLPNGRWVGENFADLSPEERRARQSRGGYARAEAEKRRATLRILAQEFGQSKIKNEKIKAMLANYGIDPDDAVQDMLLVLQCFQQIGKGNPKWADIYLRIRQESNPDFLDLKKAEIKLRRAELALKERAFEKQLTDANEDGEEKQKVVIYLPQKGS